MIYAFCHWTEDSDGDYDTDCDQEFCIFGGTPKENGMRFCCYCGKPLVEVQYQEEGYGMSL